MTSRLKVLGGLLLCGWASGCAPNATGEELRVFAASSLTEVVEALTTSFRRRHAAVDVQIVSGGSQILRLQIEEGAPADIFVSANAEHVDSLEREGLLGERRVFAHNELALVVPKENPAGIESFFDLPMASRIVLANENVPAGRYARALLRRGGARYERAVLARVVSEESNVRLVRSKVELGECDAGFVYLTDAEGRSSLERVPIPEELNVRVDYHLARLSSAPADGAAGAWLEHIASAEGRSVIREHQFREPRVAVRPSALPDPSLGDIEAR